jgi:hypothetical protein
MQAPFSAQALSPHAAHNPSASLPASEVGFDLQTPTHTAGQTSFVLPLQPDLHSPSSVVQWLPSAHWPLCAQRPVSAVGIGLGLQMPAHTASQLSVASEHADRQSPSSVVQ